VAHVKTLLCLANSKKQGGMCVAGLEIDGRALANWIRPVSSRPSHAVSASEQTLADGSVPHVLDLIRIGLLRHTPSGYQNENWLLDPQVQWERRGRWSYDDVVDAVDRPPTLWANDDSSGGGLHDRVRSRDLTPFDDSLVLVAVDDATVVVRSGWDGKGDVRLRFRYRRARYILRVTDSRYHSRYLARGVGQYGLSAGTLLTVSLAEPWVAEPGGEAYSYKVVAAIIDPEG